MFKKILLIPLLFTLLFISLQTANGEKVKGVSGAPPYGTDESEVPKSPLFNYQNWERPSGPARVGVQIGHYKNDEVPEELHKLKGNTGAYGGGKWEWEVNYKIAHLVADKLQNSGVVVDIIPATVPPEYWADVFIAIHADGSLDRTKSGYKFAGPWRDLTGNAVRLVALLSQKYEKATGLPRDENITRNMRGYYAFAWWKYRHAVHPMTTAVIAETGFLTNSHDQQMLVKSPEIPADAIGDAIIDYLESEELL